MVWGKSDASGLRAVDSSVGRIGQLACWEHYNPLARYAMMVDGERERELAPPPTGKRALELWVQHAAGRILFDRVRAAGIAYVSPDLPDATRVAAESAIDASLY